MSHRDDDTSGHGILSHADARTRVLSHLIKQRDESRRWFPGQGGADVDAVDVFHDVFHAIDAEHAVHAAATPRHIRPPIDVEVGIMSLPARTAPYVAAAWLAVLLTAAATSGLVRHALPVLLAVSALGALLAAGGVELMQRMRATATAATEQPAPASTQPPVDTASDPNALEYVATARQAPLPQPVVASEPPEAVAGDPSPAASTGSPSSGVLTMPKAGSRREENEDGAALDARHGLAALSDGASSSYDSGRWARHLCERYITDAPALDPAGFSGWVAAAAASYGASEPEVNAAEGWWGEAVADAASHATFVAVAVDIAGDDRASWSAVAVGDSVVVHLSPDGGQWRCVDAFPVDHSGGFAGRPWLLTSDGAGRPPVRFLHGSAAPGDVLLLMSDELVHWSLSRAEAGMPVWNSLLVATDLGSIVDAARAANEMVNDDCTLVRLVVAEGSN